jgi:CheY-like chemotaxis protein
VVKVCPGKKSSGILKREAEMVKTSTNSAKSVLFADNDALLLEAVGDFLRASGFEVHLAQDGLRALEICRKNVPDFVILDIVMPRIDGARVCWFIRQDPKIKDTPIIVFSSLSGQDFRNFPQLSADAYVAKGPLPIACDNLIQAIRRIEGQGRQSTAADSGIIGYNQVRPRKMIQEMLDERRHYANVLRALGAGVVELDPTGRISLANPGACRILKAKEVQLVGENLTSFISPQDRKALQDLFAEFAKAAEPQRCRITVHLGDASVPLQVCAIMEGRDCESILVILESAETGS